MDVALKWLWTILETLWTDEKRSWTSFSFKSANLSTHLCGATKTSIKENPWSRKQLAIQRMDQHNMTYVNSLKLRLNKFKISGATMTTWWFKQGYFFPLILVQQNFSEVWQFLSYTEVILLDFFCINSVQSNMSKNDSTFYKMAYYIDTQANFKHCVENLLLFQFSPFFSSSSFFGNFV